MRCPSCQTESSGAYCPECGTPLKAVCRSCNGQLVPGARYCTHCGEPVGSRGSNLPWYIAGIALVALIVAIILPATRGRGTEASAGVASAMPAPEAGNMGAVGGSASGTPPPLTGSPREEADQLFNHIMQLKESGDSARAAFFLPMGIQAYQMAGDLDDDGLYHLSLLENMKGDAAAARATAEKILAGSPDNVLALGAAAEAAVAQGQTAAARKYYQHLVDVFPVQKSKDLPEYKDHAQVLPAYDQEARAFLGAR